MHTRTCIRQISFSLSKIAWYFYLHNLLILFKYSKKWCFHSGTPTLASNVDSLQSNIDLHWLPQTGPLTCKSTSIHTQGLLTLQVTLNSQTNCIVLLCYGNPYHQSSSPWCMPIGLAPDHSAIPLVQAALSQVCPFVHYTCFNYSNMLKAVQQRLRSSTTRT